MYALQNFLLFPEKGEALLLVRLGFYICNGVAVVGNHLFNVVFIDRVFGNYFRYACFV